MMTMGMKNSKEMERVFRRYKDMFGEIAPLQYVGFARIYRAFKEKKPVPFAEYEHLYCTPVPLPLYCCARTSEDEKLIIEYEELFNEDCPMYVEPEIDTERIKRAIKENKPVPESEYAHLLGIV